MLHSPGSWALTVGAGRSGRGNSGRDGSVKAGGDGVGSLLAGGGAASTRGTSAQSAQRKPAIQVRPLALQCRAPGLACSLLSIYSRKLISPLASPFLYRIWISCICF